MYGTALTGFETHSQPNNDRAFARAYTNWFTRMNSFIYVSLRFKMRLMLSMGTFSNPGPEANPLLHCSRNSAKTKTARIGLSQARYLEAPSFLIILTLKIYFF